jgi:hypothetical protein
VRRFSGWGILAVFLLGAPVFAQQQRPWWYTLEQGKSFFRSGAYGSALMAFDDARRARADQFSRMVQDMTALLSLPEVRRFGDSLDRVEAYIGERSQSAAAAALAELYYRAPKASLGGSASRVLTELDRLKAYPEAEYWLGETYRAEGELGLALKQYEKAFALRDLLEAPSFDVEILYKIVEIHKLSGKYQEMENQANQILIETDANGNVVKLRDSLWAGDLARAAMLRTLENEGIGRFLTLYRYNNTPVERAHRFLGFFHYASSRLLGAEHLMFAFLIQNTLLIEEALRSRYDFSFTSLAALMDETRRQRRLMSFLEETEYFKTVYYLASALYASNKNKPALELWEFLSSCPEAGEWRVRARGQLREPHIEQAVEMP